MRSIKIQSLEDRKPICKCGKVSFSKKDAQTKKNQLEKRGLAERLRVYQCPASGFQIWHLTSQPKLSQCESDDEWEIV